MFRIHVRNENQQAELVHDSGPIMVGRAPSAPHEAMVIHDRYVSREHVLLEETRDGVRIDVVGSSPIDVDGHPLEPGKNVTRPLPIKLAVGYTDVELTPAHPEAVPKASSEPVAGLATISRPPREFSASQTLQSLQQETSAATIAQWFERLLAVQKAAAGSEGFYAETARAVVDLVGLDRGLVVLRNGDDWQTIASYSLIQNDDIAYSRTVLSELLRQRRTFYESSIHQPAIASLARLDAYVASPIFDAHGEIVGAVFGSRDLRTDSHVEGIQPLEAQFVQVLAGAVSAGLARLDQEAESARLQVQLERFASAKIASELKRNPALLDPQKREITVMFADIRKFSSIAEQLGADLAYQLIRAVMDRMTSCVMDSDGLIIDYAGDGLAAMWNAPTDQPRHRQLACETAIAMQAAMTELDSQWRAQIKGALALGIGVHSGVAQVGNSGSRWRMKYSPIGHTVNLASRIEGATKQLGVSTLLTNAARIGLDNNNLDNLVTRRIGPIRVLGIREPVEVFQLLRDGESVSPTFQNIYEQALACFEKGQCSDAEAAILEALDVEPDDRPAQLLLRRIRKVAVDDGANTDSVWDLDAK